MQKPIVNLLYILLKRFLSLIMHSFFYKIFLFIITIGIASSCKKENDTLFSLLDPADTGVHFSNQITSSDSLNILNFEYIYNGGGVGIGDFNGDSLPDMYFTGNMVSNKLYINKSDIKNARKKLNFEDITTISKTSGNGKWCSGVAIVDINDDQKLDIYVCANVKKTGAERSNLLYVNQGNDNNNNPIFKEMAQEYGLADTTFSTNAAFFDYDNDGDLDVYILVDKVSKDAKPNTYQNIINDGTAPNNDQLYNASFDPKVGHLVYTNVTQKAGILFEGFGLGINITDINNDGYKDVYVTNDFITNDFFWINQKNGTFKNESAAIFKHTSYSAMGNDIADINNDGLPEVLALDMLPEDNYRRKMLMGPNNYQTYLNNEAFGYQYQTTRNTLQFNQGFHPKTQLPIFSEIANYMGVAATDWSWCPLLADFDNDGFRDLYITNGFPKDITDHDFMAYRNSNGAFSDYKITMANIPEVKITNYAFQNKAGQGFEKTTKAWGLEKNSFSNGAAYADFDLDGDLDFVVNNINDSAFVYQNNINQQLEPQKQSFVNITFSCAAPNMSAIGAKLEIFLNNGQILFYENSPYRGYLSTVEAKAHFGIPKDAKIKKTIVTWPNGKITEHVISTLNKTYNFSPQNGKEFEINKIEEKPYFTAIETNITHKEYDFVDFNIQKLLPHKLSQTGPILAKADVNGDGLEDIFYGGSNRISGQILIQKVKGAFAANNLVDTTKISKNYEETGAIFFDVDKDGDQDLYLSTGGNEQPANHEYYADKLYLNNGNGKFEDHSSLLPKINYANGSVTTCDYDQDGDQDLFIGVKHIPYQYPKSENSYILQNNSTPNKISFTIAPKAINQAFFNIGMVTSSIWQDFDKDGWQDLVVIGEFTPIMFFKNEKGKSFTKKETTLSNLLGNWQSVATLDIDLDGDQDLVVGNMGQNTLLKASEKYPYTVYGNDFNKDGYYDAIPTLFLPDIKNELTEFPYNVREDLIKQIIGTKKNYPDFATFAKDPFAKMYKEEEIQKSIKSQINFQQSIVIQNKGNWTFEYKALPMQVQWSNINQFLVYDLNKDKFPDLLTIGNDYGFELFNGRQDASNGLVLINNTKGNFNALKPSKTNFITPLDARSILLMTYKNAKPSIFVGQNKSNFLQFQLK